jgi:hypothetical protein
VPRQQNLQGSQQTQHRVVRPDETKNIHVNQHPALCRLSHCKRTNLAKTALANNLEHGKILHLGLRAHGKMRDALGAGTPVGAMSVRPTDH